MKKIAAFFLFVLISSCVKEEPIPTYTLSVISVPSEGGKITVTPQSPSYNEGTQVSLTAEPNEGYIFKNWEGDASGSTSPLATIMNSNKAIVGVFMKREYPLTLIIEGEGTVNEEIVTNPSGREYTHGTTVKLTPVPKQGWIFDSWSGDLTGTESPKNILVDKAKTVSVKFRKNEFELKITIEGEGSVEEKVISQPNGKVYPAQTIVELTPKPKEGWIFDSWSGDLTGKESPKNITVDKEKNVTAKFILNPNFYLAENGVTCKCPNAKVGEKGIISGEIYEAVDNDLIRKRLSEGAVMNRLCTYLVTSMESLFQGRENFNQPIGNWDVGNVTNMSYMFEKALMFNQPIGKWNVGNVENMKGMFKGGEFYDNLYTEFNQQIGDWNVGKVIDMSYMFSNSLFNQPIGNWNVGNVTNMSYMFGNEQFNQGYTPFNQPIGNWDVSKVVNMEGMFKESNEFNQPIGNWDVSSVRNMSHMFEYAYRFDQPIGNWKVGNVEKMDYMFSNSSFKQNISGWCVSKILEEPLEFVGSIFFIFQNRPKWGTCPNG
jgi:uncharacterized repeat protein (TIGR02543 family)